MVPLDKRTPEEFEASLPARHGANVVTLISTGWIVIVVTALIVFRRRVVNVLLRFAAQKDDELGSDATRSSRTDSRYQFRF